MTLHPDAGTAALSAGYPLSAGARTRWVQARRLRAPAKNQLDPSIPYAFLEETEISASGTAVPTATIFLTNRECPYRCLMCDLWINTLDESVHAGAIAGQVRHALERLPGVGALGVADRDQAQVKLYNAGSFFDPAAIPVGDYPEIAAAVSGFGRVIVECHPAFVGPRVPRFRALITGRLEIAIGLETAHAPTLDRLNKRFTLDDFRRAAALVVEYDADLRVFLLLNPPFLTDAEGLEWAMRSVDVAFDAGATACCIIPTRGGNGAMEALAAVGAYRRPRLNALEQAVEYCVSRRRGRVFADLWDAEAFFTCTCSPARARRLEEINRTQAIPPPIPCGHCQ